MTTINSFTTMIGFAAKAGALAYGANACENGLRSGKVKLVLVDCALTARGRKSLVTFCEAESIPLIDVAPEGTLGKSCGKDNMIVGVTRNEFADVIFKTWTESQRGYDV